MKKFRSRFLTVLVCICASLSTTFQSCSHHDDDPKIAGKTIHIAGNQYASDGTTIATYWKNGKAITLSNSQWGSLANAITVAGDTTYVAGITMDENSVSTSVLWKVNKNDEVKELPLTSGDQNAIANAIVINGTDIYVGGEELEPNSNLAVAKIWKVDNQETISVIPLADNGQLTAEVNSAVIFENFLYAGGEETSGNDQSPVAKYWKVNLQNSQVESLSLSTESADVNSIAVSDENIVRTVGSSQVNSKTIAQYWKRENVQVSPVALTSEITNASANSILLDGDIIYIAGNELNSNSYIPYNPKYWTIDDSGNIKEFDLPDGSGAKSMALANNEVYILGNKTNSGNTISQIKYWIVSSNGSIQSTDVTSNDEYCSATAIFVTE